RKPVFLIGQIGDQAVSLHGERGQLVFQTPEGGRQELSYHDLGMANTNPTTLESSHERRNELTVTDRNSGAPEAEESAAWQRGQAQREIQDGHSSIPRTGDLGNGESRRE